MTKKSAWILLVMAVFCSDGRSGDVRAGRRAGSSEHTTNWVGVGAAFALGIAAAGCGIGQGLATAAACEGTARNPGAGGAVRTAFIIGVALIESLTLYALVIVLI